MYHPVLDIPHYTSTEPTPLLSILILYQHETTMECDTDIANLVIIGFLRNNASHKNPLVPLRHYVP